MSPLICEYSRPYDLQGNSDLNRVRLSELDLSHNQLTSVKNIKSLPSLEKLNLSSNQLTSIGCSETLRSLRSLKLSHNQFCALDVRMFPSLNLLYADRNSLSTILGLDHCRSLETLSAREQALADDGNCFDMDLGMMTDVRKIYLSSNRLSSRCLSPSVPLLSLQLFDVASCNIQSLPGDFALSFPNVKVLNLNFNSLTGIEEIAHMKCLSRLSAAGNRISRLRRLCQVLSRTGRSVKGAGCSMQKVDLRGNPLTVRFYPPPITGSGKEAISKLPAKPNPRKDLPDVLSTLDPLKSNIPLLETWDHSNSDRDEGDQTIDDKTPINDPYTLPAADPQVDEKYLSHLDESTRLRRRILELMLYVGSGGSIKYLDGLRLRPALEPGSDLELAWSRLEDLGVLKKRKDKKEIKDKKEKKDKKTKAIK